MIKAIPDQLQLLRKRANLSMDELAQRMGYKRASSIQRYISPNDFRGEYLSPSIISKLMNALEGLGTPPITESEILSLGGPLIKKTPSQAIPVISYVQAGNWTSALDAYALGNGFSKIQADQSVSDYAFALEIKGSSMMPMFQEGDRVIIEPNLEPIPGDFVVAKLAYEDDTVFKQYRPRGYDENRMPIIELKPLNELWPPIILDAKNPGSIIGTMIEHHSYRKRT